MIFSSRPRCFRSVFFFFNDTATTEIYTLSLHDALPISQSSFPEAAYIGTCARWPSRGASRQSGRWRWRSEEHTSELQSQSNLVCRLLLEKKNSSLVMVTLVLIVVWVTSTGAFGPLHPHV